MDDKAVSDEAAFWRARYDRACHAMQSGVAAEMNLGGGATEPKHLRVGVNSAMVENAAVVELLIAKGVITEAEYMRALAEQMEQEVARYEVRLESRTGAHVRLA